MQSETDYFSLFRYFWTSLVQIHSKLELNSDLPRITTISLIGAPPDLPLEGSESPFMQNLFLIPQGYFWTSLVQIHSKLELSSYLKELPQFPLLGPTPLAPGGVRVTIYMQIMIPFPLGCFWQSLNQIHSQLKLLVAI